MEKHPTKTKSKIETLVLPVAGMGKRLSPLTLHLPKALVQLRGKPLIEYAIEETMGTDIVHVVIVASPSHKKRLERYVAERKKIFPHLEFSLKIQTAAAGNGHAVLQAADVLDGSPFAVRFCDDVLFTKPTPLRALSELYSVFHESIVLLEKVPHEHVSSYGVVKASGVTKPHQFQEGHIYEIQGVVEKPRIQDAPSDLTIVGGYVLHPRILKYLEMIRDSLPELRDDVLLLSDAFKVNLDSGYKIFGWQFEGKRFDCGTLNGLTYAEKTLSKLSPVKGR